MRNNPLHVRALCIGHTRSKLSKQVAIIEERLPDPAGQAQPKQGERHGRNMVTRFTII